MNQPDVVAAYGTLRRGDRNHHLLEDCPFLGTGFVDGAVYDVPATPYRAYPYPALVTGEQGRVRVELYRLADPALIETIRRNWPFLRDRRVDAYGAILNRYLG